MFDTLAMANKASRGAAISGKKSFLYFMLGFLSIKGYSTMHLALQHCSRHIYIYIYIYLLQDLAPSVLVLTRSRKEALEASIGLKAKEKVFGLMETQGWH